MADDRNKRGAPDNQRIDVHDQNELRNWAKSFGLRRQTISLDAVAQVGTSAEKVGQYLRDVIDPLRHER